MIRRILTALFVVTVFAGSASLAVAGDYSQQPQQQHCTWKKVCTYETITEYVTKQEAYTKMVTMYDHCGKPYQCPKVCYRDVEVPVERTIPVTKWVKVCY